MNKLFFVVPHIVAVGHTHARKRIRKHKRTNSSLDSMGRDNASTTSLGNLISQRSLNVSFHSKSESFWPRGCFDDLLTSATVSAELWPASERISVESTTSNAKRRELLVAFILKNSKTTFAILLSFLRSGEELRQAVSHFRDAGLDDSNLPIISKDIKAKIFYKLGSSSEYRYPWSGFREKNFCDIWQWRFTAPVFHHNQSFLGLHDKTILPFIKVNSRGAEGSGKYGDVHEVTVHPAHIGSILPVSLCNILNLYSFLSLHELTCKGQSVSLCQETVPP